MSDAHKVPVLITIDVDPNPAEQLRKGIDITLDLLSRYRIRSTFFFPALQAEKTLVDKVILSGHEIGCHGLSHGDEEELDRLDEKTQYDIVGEATSILQSVTASSPYSFRAPRMKISAVTLRILQNLGYGADCSVCSQRLDLISSNLINFGWLRAPRQPYYPSMDSPYRKGHMRIREVPVSALLAPFISATLRVFGLGYMKALFALLYYESRISGKPIVYLFHPHEFLYRYRIPLTRDLITPNREWLVTGFPIRYWLARREGEEVREMSEDLFGWISRRDVEFMTVREYCQKSAIGTSVKS